MLFRGSFQCSAIKCNGCRQRQAAKVREDSLDVEEQYRRPDREVKSTSGVEDDLVVMVVVTGRYCRCLCASIVSAVQWE